MIPHLLIVVVVVLSSSSLIRAAEVCCPGLACFSDNPPWNNIPLPECPEVMEVSQRVFTRGNPTVGQVITRNTIPPAFEGYRWTIWLTHGYLGGRNNNWLSNMKDALLAQGDYNVIITGWDGGSQTLWYPQSASNTRTVGSEIGMVANNVIAGAGSANARHYCVGHSLGSHVCGHAGQWTKFGRITGMDPAGPMFENRDSSCGLNPDCADYVDVMHTNGESSIILNLGTLKPLGHVDFYPNGGGRQPGCLLDPYTAPLELNDIPKLDDEIDWSMPIDLTPACSHMRAIWYYTESVISQCFLSRHQCTDPYNIPGSCTQSDNPVQSMGYPANNYAARGIFYLTTGSDDPYCNN